MLAARRLYAPCVLLFPGSQERGLQKVYANLDKTAYNFAEAGELHWEDFGRLVLVDTRQRSRVSHVAPLLDRPDMRVEIWDHHPDSPDDIKAAETHLAEVGAVTSLLVLSLEAREIRLNGERPPCSGSAYTAIQDLLPTLPPPQRIFRPRPGCSGKAWTSI